MKGCMPKLTLVLLLTVACSRSLFGQSLPERFDWEGSAFAGVSFVGTRNFSTSVSGSAQETSRTVGVHYAPGYQIGLRLKENLGGEYWGADLEYSFANQPLRLTNLTPSIQNLPLGQSIHQFSYSVSYTAFSPADRLRPYFKVGAGTSLFYIHGDSKDEALRLGVALEDSWKFAVNWGGGLTYRFDDQSAFTFDFKDQLTGLPSYGLPSVTRVVNGLYEPGVSRSGLLHNVQFKIGGSFQWDWW